MKSVGAMIRQLDGLADTADVTPWENEFIESVVEKTDCGKVTVTLTEKQVSAVEKIYRKHFGD